MRSLSLQMGEVWAPGQRQRPSLAHRLELGTAGLRQQKVHAEPCREGDEAAKRG